VGVLKFTKASSERLKWSTVATALANVSDGAWSMAVLVKRNALGGGSNFNAMGYVSSGTGNGSVTVGMSFNVSDKDGVDVGSGSFSTTSFSSTTSPYLLVISKTNGTVAPRLGWKLGSGGAWTHEALGTTMPNQIASTMLNIGCWPNTPADFFEGWIGLVAFWEGALADLDKEELDNNWRTSDIWNSSFGRPVFLAELNVAGASVIDLAGNATSLAATGTSLDNAETLDNWNFDGTGSPAIIRHSILPFS